MGSINSPGMFSIWGERGRRAAALAVVRVRRKGRWLEYFMVATGRDREDALVERRCKCEE